MEACGFRDLTEKFAKAGTVVLGISTDKLADQQKFTAKEGLSFSLLADPEKKITKTYGVLSPRGFASRVTFVIDKNGVLRKVYDKVSPATHAAEVLEYVQKNLTD